MRKIVFSDTYEEEDWLFVQMPNQEAELAWMNNQAMFIGEKDQEAILIDNEHTFKVQRAEGTNTMMFIPLPIEQISDPNDMAPMVIHSSATSFLSLTPIQPNWYTCKRKMMKKTYSGGEVDGYSLDDLMNMCQTSKKEMLEALKPSNGLEMVCFSTNENNDIYCALDPLYASETLSLLLSTCTEHDWPLSAIPIDALSHVVQNEDLFPDAILKHFLSMFGEKKGNIVEMNLLLLGRYELGHMLLKHAPISFMALEEMWNHQVHDTLVEAVPETMNWTSLLSGMCYALAPHRSVVRLYEKDAQLHSLLPFMLPLENPRLCFAELFSKRSVWPEEEIRPFIQGMVHGQYTFEKYLYTFCRRTQDGHGKLVSKR